MEKKLYEIIARALVDGVSLFEEEVLELNALESIMEESNTEPVKALEKLLTEDETGSVEESEDKVVEEQQEESVEDSIDKLLASLSEEE